MQKNKSSIRSILNLISCKFIKIIFLILSILLVILNCSSTDNKETIKTIIISLPPCSCTAKMIRPIAVKKVLDTGLEEYSLQKKVILSEDIEEELLSIPEVFLYDVTLKNSSPVKTIPDTNQKNVWEATGKLAEPKLEVFLKEKNVEEVNGYKVYTKKGSGQKGLELIQSYSKEKRKERKLDRDKYYKDRIDMLEKIKR